MCVGRGVCVDASTCDCVYDRKRERERKQPVCNREEEDADCETQTFTRENRRGGWWWGGEGWMEGVRECSGGGGECVLTLYVASAR